MDIDEVYRDYYRVMSSSSSDVFFVLDENLDYLYLSPSVKQLRGINAEDAMMEPVGDTYANDSYEKICNVFTQALLEIDPELDRQTFTRTIQLEMKRYNPEGIIQVESSVQMIVEKGKVKYISGVTKDITHIVDAKKLQGMVEMAGATCHEFAQPLQSLMGYVQLLQSEIDEMIHQNRDLSLTQLKNYADKANISINRVTCLLNKTQTVLQERKATTTKYGTTEIVDYSKLRG